MKKKFVLRIFFFIIIFFFLLFFFLNQTIKYNHKRRGKTIEEKIDSSNIIKDVSYISKDSKGNEYKLEASEGVIDQKENNYIFLTSVKGVINLIDYNLIEISSDFGKYNINNYDTIFSKNVIITYLDNTIKGEYLDFSWDKNLMIISKNVILENDKSSLKTDVIEIDIRTKNVKIFMYEENKKINIKTLKLKMAVIKKFRIKSFKKVKTIIEFENVSLAYGNRLILDNISFKINEGQIFGMLGPNGVGKSTIFNLITGLITPKHGKIKINGEDVSNIPFI